MWRTLRGNGALSEEAASLVEYAIILAFLALVALTGMRDLGGSAGKSAGQTAQAVRKAGKTPPGRGNPHGPGITGNPHGPGAKGDPHKR